MVVSWLGLSFIGFNPPASAAIASAAPSNTSYGGSPDILVPAVQGPSVGSRLSSRAKTSWPWYITRASGLIAALALFTLILSGVGMITGYTFRLLEPLTAWATHRAVGIVFAVSVLIHGIALLFDHFVPFSVIQVLVPFASKYREVTIAGHNFGSLWVALGIFASYALLALVLTSLLWMDKKPHRWKSFHYLAYLIAVLVFFHALNLGTDLMHGIFRTLWIIMGLVIAIAIIFRLRRARSI